MICYVSNRRRENSRDKKPEFEIACRMSGTFHRPYAVLAQKGWGPSRAHLNGCSTLKMNDKVFAFNSNEIDMAIPVLSMLLRMLIQSRQP